MGVVLSMGDIIMPCYMTVLAYLLGCFCAGYYLVLGRTGKDLRELGSGTLGARNTGRVLGKWGFALALALDMGKGVVVIALSRVANLSGLETSMVCIAVVLGHIFPVQLKFHGGKGIAVATGCLLVMEFTLITVLAFAFIILMSIKRSSKFCGLVLIAVLPVASFILADDKMHVPGIVVVAMLLLLAHVEDVKNLLPDTDSDVTREVEE
jgi:glycerol-3-phosphate acyltransferase PlsY